MSNKRNFLVIVVLAVIVLYFSLKDEFTDIMSIILQINVYYLLFALGLYFFHWLLKTIVLHNLLLGYNKSQTFFRSAYLNLMTIFFNGVTPFALGGQPFQIYYLTRDGFTTKESGSVILQYTTLYQIAIITVTTVALIMNAFLHVIVHDSALFFLIITGYIVNVSLFLLLAISIFSNKFKLVIGYGIIKVLKMVKLVKNEEKARIDYEDQVSKLQETFQIIGKDKLKYLMYTLLYIVALSILYIVPLVVGYAVGVTNELNIINVFIVSSYVALISSFIPLPGGSGGAEYSFASMFGQFVKGPTLSALMLIWRFVTYYVGLFLGFVAFTLYKEKDEDL